MKIFIQDIHVLYFFQNPCLIQHKIRFFKCKFNINLNLENVCIDQLSKYEY